MTVQNAWCKNPNICTDTQTQENMFFFAHVFFFKTKMIVWKSFDYYSLKYFFRCNFIYFKSFYFPQENPFRDYCLKFKLLKMFFFENKIIFCKIKLIQAITYLRLMEKLCSMYFLIGFLETHTHVLRRIILQILFNLGLMTKPQNYLITMLMKDNTSSVIKSSNVKLRSHM